MAFWKKIFKSKYTGAEIDAAVAKAGDATKVVANPTLAGTEAALEGLQVGDTKYKIDAGGGDGVMVLAFTSHSAVNKSYDEVLAAIQNNVPILLVAPEGAGFMGCVSNIPATNVIHLIFSQVIYNPLGNVGQITTFSIDYNSDGTLTATPDTKTFNVIT